MSKGPEAGTLISVNLEFLRCHRHRSTAHRRRSTSSSRTKCTRLECLENLQQRNRCKKDPRNGPVTMIQRGLDAHMTISRINSAPIIARCKSHQPPIRVFTIRHTRHRGTGSCIPMGACHWRRGGGECSRWSGETSLETG